MVITRAKSRGAGRITAETFSIPILEVLIEGGGKVKAETVIQKIGEKLKDKITEQTNWEDKAEWGAMILFREGYIHYKYPDRHWEITESGRKYYEEVTGGKK